MELQILTTPVLLLVYNNPVTTKLAFDAIRQARPSKLYIAAEGPAPSDAEDGKCKVVRSIVTDVDWECSVQTRFSDHYVGASEAISTAITWFFQHESEGIVVEYNCLPAPSFFAYCADLLNKYRDDKRVWVIGGNTNGSPVSNVEHSYFFSNQSSALGWATWKRAWDFHDLPVSDFESIFNKAYIDNLFNTVSEAEYFESLFDSKFSQNRLAWKYKWELARRINSGLTVIPQRSLVSNTGSGGIYNKVFEVNVEFPLRHPEFVMVDAASDRKAFFMSGLSTLDTVRSMAKRMLPHFIRKRLFEASFRKHLTLINKAAEDEQNPKVNDEPKKSSKPHWTVLKAITDKNQLRFFSWANMSLTMCEFDLDVLYVFIL